MYVGQPADPPFSYIQEIDTTTQLGYMYSFEDPSFELDPCLYQAMVPTIWDFYAIEFQDMTRGIIIVWRSSIADFDVFHRYSANMYYYL